MRAEGVQEAGGVHDDGLAGRTAIVTGAGSQSSGIGNGRAAAVLLARAGAHVVLVDSASDRLAETAALVTEAGGDALSLTADVTSEADCRAVVEQSVRRFGRLDVLVNNVGIVGPAESVLELDLAEWRRVVDVNVTSVILMSRFAIPYMRQLGAGSIVNLSSLAGTITHPRPAYAATKGAVLSLTRSMAMRHGPEGIRVNAVAPGAVYTPMVQVEALTPEARRARAHMVPLRREGTGWDVGNAVVFLAGDRSRWITGETLTVDGGFTADLRMSSATTVTPAGAR